jgi:hypothetical protein
MVEQDLMGNEEPRSKLRGILMDVKHPADTIHPAERSHNEGYYPQTAAQCKNHVGRQPYTSTVTHLPHLSAS